MRITTGKRAQPLKVAGQKQDARSAREGHGDLVVEGCPQRILFRTQTPVIESEKSGKAAGVNTFADSAMGNSKARD